MNRTIKTNTITRKKIDHRTVFPTMFWVSILKVTAFAKVLLFLLQKFFSILVTWFLVFTTSENMPSLKIKIISAIRYSLRIQASLKYPSLRSSITKMANMKLLFHPLILVWEPRKGKVGSNILQTWGNHWNCNADVIIT